jgi:hypothetical protein
VWGSFWGEQVTGSGHAEPRDTYRGGKRRICQSQLIEQGELEVDGRAVSGIDMLGEVSELLEWVVMSKTASIVVKKGKRRPPTCRDVRHVGHAPVGDHRACRVPDGGVSSKEGVAEGADAIPGTFCCVIIAGARGSHRGRS